jgi:hypothetical protein
MQEPTRQGAPNHSAPKFYLTGRQPLSPGAILLAIVLAVAAMYGLVYGMSHTRHAVFGLAGSEAGSAATGSSDDNQDDPNQIDTIVLGDPTDAPTPAKKGSHVSPVHPTILIRLPRSGDKVGLIPDSPAGRLLYAWLAAFNQADETSLAQVLPTAGGAAAVAAQIEIRKQTGGLNLLSAREIQPGLLVFRMRDQNPVATEVLGTLLVQPDSNPAAIGSFSLRAVEGPPPDAPSP